jgi:hypothetical protein
LNSIELPFEHPFWPSTMMIFGSNFRGTSLVDPFYKSSKLKKGSLGIHETFHVLIWIVLYDFQDVVMPKSKDLI